MDRAAQSEPPEIDEQPVEDLVRDARRGDRTAVSELYRRYARAVHAVVLARVPAAEANDLVQDVFVVMLRKLDGLRDHAAFGGWLMSIARNRAADYHRRRRTTTELPPHLAATHRPTAEAAEALEAIRTLPEAYRETLLMRLVEGMTGPEIADRTGLESGSVRVNLHRGMKMLRDKLNAEASDD